MPDASGSAIAEQIVAIREKWHTKKHPFFTSMLDGSLPIKALGIYMAQHQKFVNKAVPGFGLMVYSSPPDVRKAMVENLAEEEGLLAIPKEGHVAHDHWAMISGFCLASGMTQDEIENTEPTPGWWGRTLHYVNTMREEPVGVALAMQATQEGQQVALNTEITIPSFAKHYGYTAEDDEISFFVEHAEADAEHSRRQLDLAVKYLDTPELQARALKVCDEAVRLRWASTNDIYEMHVLGNQPMMPEGVAA